MPSSSSTRPYTLLFLDGSHENYDLLAQYPETERFGGRVQSLGGNVYHVCRGSHNEDYRILIRSVSEQFEHTEPLPAEETDKIELMTRGSFTKKNGSYYISYKAVSYTHLDVYKRQASGRGGPGPYRDGQRGPSCRGWSRRRQSP